MAKTVMTREERLAEICKRINGGKFGGKNENAVTWLSSDECEQIERFPSGSPALDAILGGGWPKGRMIELYGDAAAGKCLSKDTYVMTAKGLMTIEEVFNDNGFTASNTTRVEPTAFHLVAENGQLEETTHFTWNGSRRVFNIQTNSGFEIEATARHPIRVLNKGMVSWKHAQEIKKGDVVVVQKNMKIYSNTSSIDKDDAFLIGLIVSEGHMPLDGNRVTFTNEDQFLLSEFKRILKLKFGFDGVKEYQRGKTFEYHVNSRELVKNLESMYGLKAGLSESRVVPLCVRQATWDVQKSFISSYFMGDGGLEKGNTISMSSKSKELMRQIQLMALNFGAFGRLRKKVVKSREYWILNFYGKEAEVWEREVGKSPMDRKVISSMSKTEVSHGIPDTHWIAEAILKDCSDSDRGLYEILGDVITKKGNMTEKLISEIISVEGNYKFGAMAKHLISYLKDMVKNGWDYDVVKSVEQKNPIPTFDFSNTSHTFWSNGFVSHNTTIALHAIAEHQKKFPDQDVALLDTEFSADLTYAKDIGIDTRYLIVSQPESGEQALNLVLQLIQNGIGLIVFDSVAGLTTKNELEGDLGDAHVAEQARLLSPAMRRLVQEAGTRGCTIIWTNQIRDKVNVRGYGETTTTPGGHALKFYSSIRCKVSRISTVKEKVDGEEVAVANEVCVETKKNKVAPPFKKANMYIVFGKGIDPVIAMVDLAFSLGVLTKKGAWCYLNGEQISQGRSQLIELISSDKSLLEKIDRLCKEKQQSSPKAEVIESTEKEMTEDEGEVENV